MQERRQSDTETALRKLNEANRLRSGGHRWDEHAADRLQTEANELLAPRATGVALTEAIPPATSENFGIIDTLEDPDCIERSAQEASERRMELLCDVDSLETGLDCANSIQARNSIERMMSHQMAASHTLAMKLIAKAMNDKLPTAEATRLSNSAATLMSSFQNSALAIQKLRTGGKQNIVVQHVEMRDNSQAVIGDLGGKHGD